VTEKTPFRLFKNKWKEGESQTEEKEKKERKEDRRKGGRRRLGRQRIQNASLRF
jgi:hypothetical protein